MVRFIISVTFSKQHLLNTYFVKIYKIEIQVIKILASVFVFPVISVRSNFSVFKNTMEKSD